MSQLGDRMKFQFFQILNIIQGYLITQRENAIRFTEMKKETITLKKKYLIWVITIKCEDE